MSAMAKPLAAAILLALTAPGWAQAERGPWHMHGWGMGWGGGMVLGPLLTIGLVILLVVLLVPLVRSRGGASAPTRSARDILDERYAKGEIDREEYMRRKQDIGA